MNLLTETPKREIASHVARKDIGAVNAPLDQVEVLGHRVVIERTPEIRAGIGMTTQSSS